MSPRTRYCRWLVPAQAVGLVLLAGLLGACIETRVVDDPWGELRKMAQESSPQGPGDRSRMPARPEGENAWSVLLDRFEGEAAREEAEAMKERLEEASRVPDLWIREQRSFVTLYRGRFAHPDRPEARNALRQSRMVSLDGARPFQTARLVPLGAGAEGAADPWDLRNHSGRYSLQIGFYDEAFGSDFREAAEQAVRTLRETDDAEAYYYHGPHRSLVTVGLFDDADFKQGEGGVFHYGPRIRKVQASYPHNLANGRTIIEKHGEERATQPSFIVKVP